MFKYVLKRIVLALLTMLIIYSILFVLIRLYPIENDYWKFQRAWIVQYKECLKNIITKFDWGECTTKGELFPPVTRYISTKLKYTFYVTGVSILLSIPIGILLGLWSAVIKKKFANGIFNIIILSFGSIPVFVWTFTLQYFLCWKLDLFPFLFPNGTKLLSWRMFYGAIVPIITLALGPISTYMYVLRGSLLESYNSDYVSLLRVKGLSNWQIIKRHTFKNGIISIFPEVFSNIVFIVTNSFIVEKIYAIPGLSHTYIRTFFAIDKSRHSEWLMFGDLGVVPDYNMFLCISMFYVAIAVGTGFLLDLLYGIIDPRIRIGSNKKSE